MTTTETTPLDGPELAEFDEPRLCPECGSSGVLYKLRLRARSAADVEAHVEAHARQLWLGCSDCGAQWPAED